LRQDGSQIEQLHAMRGMESTRALQEYFETRAFATLNAGQTAGAINSVNGIPHRWVADAGGAADEGKISLDDFRFMKYAFDKANAPMAGRIAVVDPSVEVAINGLLTGTTSIDYNPHFEGIINEGFAREHAFVRNIFGWDIYTSNRLPQGLTEAINANAAGFNETDSSVDSGNGVANIFMCVLDDNTKPMMRAWRQAPKTETRRNFELKRDEFDVTARFGLGLQRVDTLGIVLTDVTKF